MKKITAKYIESHLEKTYGVCKHNPEVMAQALNEVSKLYKVEPKDAFLYIIGETNGIPGKMFTSYGFDTREGRDFQDLFSGLYYYIERNDGASAEEYINYHLCD